MKIRNTFLSIILLALTAMLFSSCENDYRWERATLTYTSDMVKPVPTTDRFGTAKVDLRLDVKDIMNNSYNIDRISLFDSYFMVWSDGFRPVDRDRINVILRTESGKEYGGRMIALNNYEYVVDIEDVNYARFIENVLYELERYGSVNMYIDVETNINQSGLVVGFKFFNNIDVRVERW